LRLSRAGWESLAAHGIRTIVDLRDPEAERGIYREHAQGIDVRSCPLFAFADERFWDPLRGETDACAFYRAALARWPERFGEAVAAIAHAAPGGVLVHCQVGKDRTGLVVALVLAAIGVSAEDVAADYDLSLERLILARARLAGDAELALALERTQLAIGPGSRAAAMLDLLDGLDVRAYLHDAGLSRADLAALRERLLE
jgi:hypothetical protein